ncbi:MAG: hypothetical protein IJZ64_00695 [Ruminococcus sp.]|nr:hypothetical protein [Ruminococcus sp.]
MKLKKLKIAGSVSAAIMLFTSSVTSITAFADVSPVPGSSFAYDFTASVVTESMTVMGEEVNRGDVEVTFQVTNNPGMLSYTVQLYYGEGYELFAYDENANFKLGSGGHDKDSGCILLCEMSPEVDVLGCSNINFDNFYIKYYFRAKDNISVNNSNFSIALTQYNFPLETGAKTIDFSPDITISSPYTLGDMDNNGYITIDDASAVDSLGAKANAFLHNRSVDVINQHLSEEKWNNWFPKLIYAETADVDENGYVENEDTQEVLNYYANHAASVPLESLVGQTRFKTIHVKNA